MSSHKNIIFFVKDETHEDVSKMYSIIEKHGEHKRVSDDRKYNMGWSETYWIGGSNIWWFKQVEDFEYYGIEKVKSKFKDYKVICHISEQMDYENPYKFNKSTKKTFNMIASEMGVNEIYVMIHDSTDDDNILYLPILDSWKGNFYDTKQNRDKKIKELGL